MSDESMQHRFTIAIGDWSGDGHGHSRDFTFTANKPIEAVREAYFAAEQRLPLCKPSSFCDRYEDSRVPAEKRAVLRAAGAPLPTDEALDDGDGFSPEDMAQIVAWFCAQGDPDLRIDYTFHAKIPTLHFYGQDKQGRHIEGHGYGLFL